MNDILSEQTQNIPVDLTQNSTAGLLKVTVMSCIVWALFIGVVIARYYSYIFGDVQLLYIPLVIALFDICVGVIIWSRYNKKIENTHMNFTDFSIFIEKNIIFSITPFLILVVGTSALFLRGEALLLLGGIGLGTIVIGVVLMVVNVTKWLMISFLYRGKILSIILIGGILILIGFVGFYIKIRTNAAQTAEFKNFQNTIVIGNCHAADYECVANEAWKNNEPRFCEKIPEQQKYRTDYGYENSKKIDELKQLCEKSIATRLRNLLSQVGSDADSCIKANRMANWSFNLTAPKEELDVIINCGLKLAIARRNPDLCRKLIPTYSCESDVWNGIVKTKDDAEICATYFSEYPMLNSISLPYDDRNSAGGCYRWAAQKIHDASLCDKADAKYVQLCHDDVAREVAK